MQLLKPIKGETCGIHIKAQKVAKITENYTVAQEMINWMDTNNGSLSGLYKSGFAVAHCQVEEKDPLNLFVVAKELIGEEGEGKTKKSFLFPDRAIWNTEILETPVKVVRPMPKREVKFIDHKAHVEIHLEDEEVDNTYRVKEACLSFPMMSEKNTTRFFRIKVRYQIMQDGKVTTVEEWVEGLKAHIFQHEDDHFNAKNIYNR